IGVVWLTTLVVTVLATWWGEPMSYRRGFIYRHDFRARVDFEVVNHIPSPDSDPGRPANSGAVFGRELPKTDRYQRGLVLFERGQPIQERQLELLKAEHCAF